MNNESKIFTGIGLDFETGGLDSTKNGITQIALQSIRLDTLELIDRYVSYVAPYHRMVDEKGSKKRVLKTKFEKEKEKEPVLMDYEDEALSYSGINFDTLLKSGADMKKIAHDTLEFGKTATLSKGKQTKPVLIGQNITFDIGFLQQLMTYAGLTKEFEKVFAGTKDFYGNFQPHYIDTIDLARLALANDPLMPSYKLEIICSRLGIELDDAHDADADVTATLNVARVCAARLRNMSVNAEGVIHKAEKSRKHFKI